MDDGNDNNTGMSRIMRMIMVDKKVAWAEATVILLASIFGMVRIVTAIPRVRKILVNAKGLGLENFGLEKMSQTLPFPE